MHTFLQKLEAIFCPLDAQGDPCYAVDKGAPRRKEESA